MGCANTKNAASPAPADQPTITVSSPQDNLKPPDLIIEGELPPKNGINGVNHPATETIEESGEAESNTEEIQVPVPVQETNEAKEDIAAVETPAEVEIKEELPSEEMASEVVVDEAMDTQEPEDQQPAEEPLSTSEDTNEEAPPEKADEAGEGVPEEGVVSEE